MDLKPNKTKINIALMLWALVYFGSEIGNFITQRGNIAIEQFTFQLGGDVAERGRELNRLYELVGADVVALPAEQRSSITYIDLKYKIFRWLIMLAISYICACAVIHRLDREQFFNRPGSNKDLSAAPE